MFLQAIQYTSDEYMWSMPSFFIQKDSDRIFLGGGDMNSRIGNIPNCTTWTCRENPDVEINMNGRNMTKICMKYNLMILNNLNFDELQFL